MIGGDFGNSVADAYPLYSQLPALTGCGTANDELACMRAVPASTIIDLQLHSGAFPIISPNLDPDVVPEDPFVALAEHGSPVPLLIGSNQEEWAALGEDDGVPPLDEATYEAEIHAQFDPLKAGAGNRVLRLYPAAAYDSPRYAHIDVESDFGITCWTRDVARVAAGHHKVWRYLYTHRYENDPFLNSLRAFHGGELFFVFGNLSKIYYTEIPYTPSADEVVLSNQIMDYWTHFAATGDPNAEGERPWLSYDAGHDNIFQLDTIKKTINGYHNDRCDYLDSLPLPGVGVPPITK